ncbi:hypothetical protein Bbelb_137800 [Branchiostoma belcheri]|nr:hypothetical protein Bbelb_137800 [Branchiostoma belcheri]
MFEESPWLQGVCFTSIELPGTYRSIQLITDYGAEKDRLGRSQEPFDYCCWLGLVEDKSVKDEGSVDRSQAEITARQEHPSCLFSADCDTKSMLPPHHLVVPGPLKWF